MPHKPPSSRTPVLAGFNGTRGQVPSTDLPSSSAAPRNSLPSVNLACKQAKSSFCPRSVWMYCEHCGLQIFPKHPICTRCGESPTYQLFQLASLCTLLLVVICNGLVAILLLPRFSHAHYAGFYFRSWLWLTDNAAIYGWAPLAAGILAWDYFVRRKSRQKIKSWLTRKLLSFVLVAGVTPVLPWWVPAGQPPQNFMSLIHTYPGLPSGLAWVAMSLVIIALCSNAESRLALLGTGRVLGAVSVASLFILLTLTVLGWSLAS